MIQSETLAFQAKTVDRFNREKLYIQLTRIFLDEINAGRWALNERIPSEDELCRLYHVSKITVRQAINNLVSDGYLVKLQGKGTFLLSSRPVVGLAMRTRFTEDMFGEGVETVKELISKGFADPSAEVKGYLKTEDRIYQILCRRLVNTEPAYLDESYVPFHVVPDIEKIDVINTSFYAFLQERALSKIFKMIQTVEIQSAPASFAKHLDISPEVPVLAVHRLFLGPDNTPVGYTRFLGRSDRYKFQTEFERIR
ncbi:MAG: phosphonate metabolism transcriptional regulator PhnF [Thermodesulfovibrionales bacterium]